jgi:class 3 adenylate cyclase
MQIPETRYAKTVDGVHVAYQVFGAGSNDIVYVPGWISNVETNWDLGHHAALFRGLAAVGRLIVFDRRGSGLSDRPDRAESLALELGMNDLRAVLDAAKSERPVLFGHEDGGTLAAMFAAAFPDRISALVLYSPLVKGRRSADYPFRSSDEEIDEWVDRVDQEWGTDELTRWIVHSGAPGLERDDMFVHSTARWLRSCASPGAVQAIEMMLREVDARPILPTISTPTLTMQRTGNTYASIGETRFITDMIPGARFVELSGSEDPPYLGNVEELAQAVEAFLAGLRREESELDRHLASVLFTDIVGSTTQASTLGDRAWGELLSRHHVIVRAMLTRYRGVEMDTAGDGFFATFDGPARAVRCAQQIIEAVEAIGVQVRAGVHVGEVQASDGKTSGLAVAIGARIAALAGPTEVLVSQTVRDLVAGSGLVFEDRGEHELKGVQGNWRLFRVVQ